MARIFQKALVAELRVPRFLRDFEHILRNQADYERIAGYILDNPLTWDQDEENPHNKRG